MRGRVFRTEVVMSEIRITLTILKILDALYAAEDQILYGLQLAQKTHMSNGALYPALNKLVAHGLVTSIKEEGDESALGRRNRRYFSLTDDGKQLSERELTKAPGFAYQKRLERVAHSGFQA